MSKKVEKISFFTPVIANETTKNERFKTIGRFAENVWNFAGTKRGVKILHVSEVCNNVYVDPSEKNSEKQNCFATLIKIIEFIALFPIIFLAKLVYRSQNDFYFVQDDHHVKYEKLDVVNYHNHERNGLENFDIKPLIISDNKLVVDENPHEVKETPSSENDAVKPIAPSVSILEAVTVKTIEAVSKVILPIETIESINNEDKDHVSKDPKQDALEIERTRTSKELDSDELKNKAQEAFDNKEYAFAFKCYTAQISRFNQGLGSMSDDDLRQAYLNSILCVNEIKKTKFFPKKENLQKKDLVGLKEQFLKFCVPCMESYQETDKSIIDKKIKSKSILLSSGESDSITFDAVSYSVMAKVEGYEITSLDQEKVTVSFSKGKRSAMEDRYLIQKIQIAQKNQPCVVADLYAVFDGHGDLSGLKGDLCAEFASKKYAEVLANELSKKDDLSDLNVWNALKMSAVELQNAWIKQNKQIFSGTTVCAALILHGSDGKGKLWIINVGDSRAILSAKSSDNDLKVIQLSTDAKYNGKATAKDYKTSLYKRHGTLTLPTDQEYYRVGGENGLQTLRSLGNQNIAGLSQRPEITCLDLSDFPEQQLTLLLATDGLTDCFGSRKTMQIIDSLDKNLRSNALVSLALEHGSEDNITAMTIDLS